MDSKKLVDQFRNNKENVFHLGAILYDSNMFFHIILLILMYVEFIKRQINETIHIFTEIVKSLTCLHIFIDI